MKFLERFVEERKNQYLSNVRPEILALFERNESISFEEFDKLRMNSYEQTLLQHKLSVEGLVKALNLYYKNSCYRDIGLYAKPPVTYEEAIMEVLLPLLLKKLES